MPPPELSTDPWNLCGTTIDGKYRIDSVVGDGGFGVVYRGVHLGFNEPIGVKCLKLPQTPEAAERDALLEQLREEGRLLHRLSKATSGIVQALDVGALTTPAGLWVPYLVLEWLEGETLAEHLRDREQRGEAGFTLAEAVALLEPAARALAVAHKHKIAHRDVKPPNLFVVRTAGGTTLKVLDFGIAKVLTSHATHTEALAATKAAPTAFTPRYGAPEQFNKQRGASGPWTDVFALGLILVELITGKKALEGDDPTQLYIAAADPSLRPTPRVRGFDIPDAVERVIAKALAVEPKHRYPDAGEFWDALVVAMGAPAAPIGGQKGARGSAGPDSALMTTADYAVRAHLDVAAEGPMAPARDAAPTVKAGHGPRVEARKSAPEKPSPVDPMSETPLFGRESLPPATGGAAGATARDEMARKPPPPSRPSRARWPWVAAALIAAGGTAAFVAVALQSRPAPPVRPVVRPRASASSVAPVPSGAATKPDGGVGTDAGTAPVASGAKAVASSGAATPLPSEMVYVPTGKLRMGEGDAGADVTVAHAFYIDRTEVTVRAYEACVAKRMCTGANRVTIVSDANDDGGSLAPDFAEIWTRRCNAVQGALDHPINCVDFPSATAYCKWRGMRLPTDAEWEWTARGAEGRTYPWGPDAPECGRACYDRNGGCLFGGAPVATCAAGVHPADRTPEGVFDLGGNVSEWVSDGFSPRLTGGVDPHGDPTAPLRVVRGGNFLDHDDSLRASYRAGKDPGTAFVSIGFRCAMDAPVAPPQP